MDVTSEEIRSSRFQGTRHVYDRREVDAFLHRAASTLEIYERKLTVTESHVENLEKALELAQSRARSMGGLDARVAELEAALAAAQHNYESAMSELESQGESDTTKSKLTRTERELAKKIESAEKLKEQADKDAEDLRREAQETADSAVSAARVEAEEILRTALIAQSSILEDVEKMRLDAEADIKSLADPADRSEDSSPGSASKTRESSAQAKAKLKKANKRRDTAEKRAEKAEQQLVRMRTELEAQMAESQAEREALEAVALAKLEASGGEQELEMLRRQVAQMRTALAAIQERFSGAAKLSPEELELATALVDLDLHDVDLLVDLTTPAMTEPSNPSTGHQAHDTAVDEPADVADEPRVAIKSKWAQSGAVPAGALTEGRAEVESSRRVWPDVEKPTPNWRDTFGSARREAAKKVAETQETEPLGFYERRLAGLRDRIREAGVEPDA